MRLSMSLFVTAATVVSYAAHPAQSAAVMPTADAMAPIAAQAELLPALSFTATPHAGHGEQQRQNGMIATAFRGLKTGCGRNGVAATYGYASRSGLM